MKVAAVPTAPRPTVVSHIGLDQAPRFLQKMDGGAHAAADSDAQPLLPLRPSDAPDLEAPAGARSLGRTATPDPRARTEPVRQGPDQETAERDTLLI